MPTSRLRRISFAALAVLLFLFPALALGQTSPGSFYLTPSVGGFVFDHGLDLDDAPAYGLGLGKNLTERWSTELSAHYIDTEVESSGKDVDGYLYRLEALYNLWPEGRLAPFLAGGVGGITLDPDEGEEDTDFVLGYGLGLKYFMSRTLALRTDVRHIIAMEAPDHNLFFTAGLDIVFGGPEPAAAPADTDGDGVIDARDKCPGTPQGVDVDRDGCPLDSDGDGVINARDKCPDTAKGVAVDEVGCPLDSDGDGVIDERDKCPDTQRGVEVDRDGCPLDSDGDGVIDARDKCPDTAKGVAVDKVGCPLDSDGDGVIDARDKCPGTDKGIMVDKDGCAQTLTLEIEFDVDKAQIKPEHADELARAAEFIRQFPSPQVLIIGHTDNQGSAEYNKDLSLRRARSVRQYLINEHDLAPENLEARGMGEERPVATNDTAKGRQENRRVEVTCCAVVMD